MITLMKGLTPEELAFSFSLQELKEVARNLKIKNRSKMNKIVLALNIEEELNN
jgi:hypothetical protein